jgi:hypothetical protein
MRLSSVAGQIQMGNTGLDEKPASFPLSVLLMI